MTFTVETLRADLNAQIVERDAYETQKNPSQTIGKQLTKHFNCDHKTLETRFSDNFFQTLIDKNAIPATGFAFINNHVKDSQRFNIKALEKVSAKLRSIVDDRIAKVDTTAQKYCVASVLTCLMNQGSDFEFSRKYALGMLNRTMRFEGFRAKACAQTFNVTDGTASTQVSSSFRTLEALDILRFDDSERERSRVTDVNLDHAFVKLVERDMMKAR